MSRSTFSIRVVDDDGDPVSGIEVTCSYGVVSGLHTERTDEDGWATFPIVENAFGFGNTPVSHVFIDHEEVHGELNPDDGETYSFTKP